MNQSRLVNVALVISIVLGILALPFLTGFIRINYWSGPAMSENPLIAAIAEGATAAEVEKQLDVTPELLEQTDPIFGGPIDWSFSAKPPERAKILNLFLDLGVDPNPKFGSMYLSGQTPMHCAIYMGYDDVVQTLLHHRAQIDAVDDEGNSALELAERYEQQDIITILKRHISESQADE